MKWTYKEELFIAVTSAQKRCAKVCVTLEPPPTPSAHSVKTNQFRICLFFSVSAAEAPFQRGRFERGQACKYCSLSRRFMQTLLSNSEQQTRVGRAPMGVALCDKKELESFQFLTNFACHDPPSGQTCFPSPSPSPPPLHTYLCGTALHAHSSPTFSPVSPTPALLLPTSTQNISQAASISISISSPFSSHRINTGGGGGARRLVWWRTENTLSQLTLNNTPVTQRAWVQQLNTKSITHSALTKTCQGAWSGF